MHISPLRFVFLRFLGGFVGCSYRCLLQLLKLPSYGTTRARDGPIFVGSVHGPRDSWERYRKFSLPDLETLSTRAWTTQEVAPSCCIICFIIQDLCWSCRQDSVDERSLEYRSRTSPRQRSSWYSLVVEFSKRFLTYPTDKLIALQCLS